MDNFSKGLNSYRIIIISSALAERMNPYKSFMQGFTGTLDKKIKDNFTAFS